jgi:hypothetical protein
MSRIDELKERLKSDAQQTWERFQDSDLYAKGKDRYDNLTPTMQKIVLYGSAVVLLLVLLSTPYSTYVVSKDNESEFLDRRQLIRDFLRADRASGDMPDIDVPPSVESVKQQIQNQAAVAKLIPEQIGAVQSTLPTSKIIGKDQLDGEFKVNYNKLNLRQVVDLGAQIQNISGSVKLREMDVIANSEDPRYLNVIFTVSVLKVPQAGVSSGGSDTGAADAPIDEGDL